MIICIVGPTGVGKTKLSIMLAKKYNAVVINGDACQVYKEMNIGTAKIKEEEKEGIPHYLFDIKKPDEEYTVFDYQKDLRDTLYRFSSNNIIIVGGSGLYLTAGLYDYKFPDKKDIDLNDFTNDELFNMCKDINEDIDIHPNNRRRLEAFLSRSNNEIIEEPKLLYKDVCFIGLTTDTDKLYERIDLRVDKMFQEGLINEVRELYNKYGNTKILNSAIGYKEIINHLDEKITLDEAVNIIETIKQNSRHYAKRQYTWFNNKMNINWFNSDYDNFDNTYKKVIDYIDSL